MRKVRVRGGSAKNSMGEAFTVDEESEYRWRKFFEQLVNGEVKKEVDDDGRRGDERPNEKMNKMEVLREEISGTLKKKEGRKSI